MSQAGTGSAINILGDPVTVDHGGTGLTSLTAGAVLVGNGTSPVTLVGPLTDGQLLIGDTAGVNPVAASLTAPAAGITITGGAGTITFALADDLAAVEGLATTGMAARTGASTWAVRTLQQPAAGISISNGDGVAGDPTFALANDLAAVEGLGGIGYPVRIAPDSWTTRTFQNPTDGSLTVTNGNGVSNNTNYALSDRVRMRKPYFENLGCSLSAGVFTIHGADGTALSASNPGIVVLQDKDNPGQLKKYTITSNSSFEDANGTSDIVGNTFGTTASVAWGNDMPMGIFAVSNDDQDSIEFALSRCIDCPVSLSSAFMGDPGSATADDTRSFWFFNNLTLTEWDSNPALMVGVIEMTKDASDDWAVSALNIQTGIGHTTNYIVYTFPTGQNGAAAGGFLLANGGTAPTWSTNLASYQIWSGGWVRAVYHLTGDGGTDGAGAVSTLAALPIATEGDFGSTNSYEGYFWVNDPTNGSQVGLLEADSENSTTFFRLSDGTFIQNADFSNGARNMRINIIYRIFT